MYVFYKFKFDKVHFPNTEVLPLQSNVLALFLIFVHENLKTKANNKTWALNPEFCHWNNCCLIYNWPVIYFCSKLFYHKNLPPWNAHIYVFLFDCIFSVHVFCIAFVDVHSLDSRVVSLVNTAIFILLFVFLQHIYLIVNYRH